MLCVFLIVLDALAYKYFLKIGPPLTKSWIRLWIGRWSELSVDMVCQEHAVMREVDANETSGELGSDFGGTLVGLSLFSIP